jgi:superfamily II DNA or RNA helicase
VLLDEVHHGGDAKSWGEAIREAFTPAVRRLCLTGTPFRSDDSPIPFVTYEEGPGGFKTSKADHTYGYADALRDGVVRPVLFLAYSGEASWRTSAGEEFTARLGEPLTQEQTTRAWRTALDPAGDWMASVLRAADQRLTQKRENGLPDAGGLVIATDQETAKAYAQVLQRVTGHIPTLVLSDDPKASGKIAEFAATNERWMIAVRMVSEGVDVPRLAVGVYATSSSTPLFFAQAIGRFVRARKPGETASVFLPSVPVLLQLASELEAERDHVLGKPHREKDGWDDELLAAANQAKDEPGEDERAFTALGTTAELDQVIFDGASFGTPTFAGSEEEQEYLGLPGLLEPDQVRTLLLQRQEEQLASAAKRPKPEVAVREARPASVQERLASLRKELNTLVAMHHHRTKKPHGKIHNQLREYCGGPPTAMASIEQLEERIATLRSW